MQFEVEKSIHKKVEYEAHNQVRGIPGILYYVRARRQTRGYSDPPSRFVGPTLLGYNQKMQQIAVSKFKSTCLAVIEDVRRTRKPVQLMRYGHPVAMIVPSEQEPRKRQLGGMRHKFEIIGDIVGPIAPTDEWTAELD